MKKSPSIIILLAIAITIPLVNNFYTIENFLLNTGETESKLLISNSDTYEQRTSPNNPFILTTDEIYTTPTNEWSNTALDKFYHKSNFLSANVVYIFLISFGPVDEFFTLKIFIEDYPSLGINTTLFQGTLDSVKFPYGEKALFLIKLADSNYVNFDLTFTPAGFDYYRSFYGMGVISPDSYSLSQTITYSDIAFKSGTPMNGMFSAGIYSLSSDKYTKTQDDNYDELYYVNVDTFSGCAMLNNSYNQLQDGGQITITNPGNYLFFHLHSEDIELSKIETTTTTTTTISFGHYYLIFITIGLISVILFKKRRFFPKYE